MRNATENIDHLVDDGLAFRSVGHGFHFSKECVELKILVVIVVLSTVVNLGVWTVEEEEKVFGIRVVGQPTQGVALEVASLHFLTEPMQVGASLEKWKP